MTFFLHLMDAIGYLLGRQYIQMFLIAGTTIALIYLIFYLITRGAR